MRDIAVIMSVYKNDDSFLLRRAIDSIINQTRKSELFLYCDGPLTEQLYSVIDYFEVYHNVNVYKGKENLGLAHALNYLIDVCVSNGFKYIARMDSDDFSYSNRLDLQYTFMEENKDIDVLGGACKEIGASYAIEYKRLPRTHEELLDYSIVRCPFIHPTVMFKASIFGDHIRYPIDTSFTEDMGLWLILLERGFKFSNIDDIVLDYRLAEDTIERRRGYKKAMSEFRLRFKYMVRLNKITLYNLTLICSRLVFHILPTSFLKVIYLKR